MLEGPVVGAAQGVLVAKNEGEAVAVVGEVAEDPGQAVRIGDALVGLVEVLLTVERVKVQQRGFEDGDAVEAPAGDGHGLDGVELGGGLRVELVEVGVEEGLIIFGGFAGGDDLFRAEAVAEGVHRGFLFSFGGFGAFRFSAVDAGGIGLVHVGG